MKTGEKGDSVGVSVTVTERGAEACMNDEAQWLLTWVHKEGIRDVVGRVLEVPELVLDHVAGRVYRVKTESNGQFFAVVGCGNPRFYSERKEIVDPKEILSLHRGGILIARMKFDHLRERREIERKH